MAAMRVIDDIYCVRADLCQTTNNESEIAAVADDRSVVGLIDVRPL
jgi:hypothetical protein